MYQPGVGYIPDNPSGQPNGNVVPSGGTALSQDYAAGGIPDYVKNQDYLTKQLAGQTPFASNQWGDLITQLQQRASGQGPSLATQNYNMASQNTVNALTSMANGSQSPGAARDAMIQMGKVGQGQAAGLAQAGTMEQQGAQESLTKALGARDQLNQNAVLDVLGKKLGLNKDQYNAVMNRQQMSNQADAQTAQAAAQMVALAAMIAA